MNNDERVPPRKIPNWFCFGVKCREILLLALFVAIGWCLASLNVSNNSFAMVFPDSGVEFVEGLSSNMTKCEVINFISKHKRSNQLLESLDFDYSPYGIVTETISCDGLMIKEMVVSARLKFVQNRLYECEFFSDPGTVQAIDEYRKSMKNSRFDDNRCCSKKTTRALILCDSEIQRELSRFVAEKL